MKIAYIVEHFPSVSQTFILNQITGLIDRGHIIDIFASNPENSMVLHPDITKYDLINRTYYRGGYYDFPRNKLARIIKGISLFKKFGSHGKGPLVKSLNLFEYGKRAISLNLLYSVAPLMNNYEILHCHFAENGNFGVLLKKLGIKGKLVTTFHGFDIRLGIDKGGSIYHNLFQIGDRFISISNHNYNHLINFGLDKDKIIYHPVGIDTAKFAPKKDQKALNCQDGDQPIRIVSVARLVEDKALHLGIAAISKVLKQLPELKIIYRVIGDGPLMGDLADLVNKLNLEDVVGFLGPLGQYEVISVLQDSHILLHSSVAEVLPVSLMEAHAVGLPIVATDVGDVQNIVLDGKSGFVVAPRNVAELAKKLVFLLQNPNIWSRMGYNGREHVIENYSIDKLNDKLSEKFNKLVNEKL